MDALTYSLLLQALQPLADLRRLIMSNLCERGERICSELMSLSQLSPGGGDSRQTILSLRRLQAPVLRDVRLHLLEDCRCLLELLSVFCKRKVAHAHFVW